MIRDLLRDQPESQVRYDVCIVGAGAAGITLAVALSRAGKRVVLLEGGGPEIEEASQRIYTSEVTSAHVHRGIHTGRFRVHGGTTRKWGGQILELDEIDFAERAWIAESGWPISKAELAHFYKEALALEGLEGVRENDAEVWKALGTVPPPLPVMQPYLSRWCPEPDFSRLQRPSLESAALDVWLHANAVDVAISDGKMDAVRCRTLEGHEALFHAEEFVFCLGAIESVRFFLQPRTSGLPWNQSGLLGHHFQDHIDCNAAGVHIVNQARFHAFFDNIYLNGFKYHAKMRLRPEIQEHRKTLNVAATMYFLSDLDTALDHSKSTAKLLLRGRAREIGRADLLQLARNLPLLARQIYRYASAHRAYNPPGAEVWLRVHCEQEPTSKSSITLSDERDALGMLRTRLDWRISEAELTTIREFVVQAAEALSGIASLTPDPDLMRGDAGFAAKCDDSNHHMGGMRMSSSPTTGVVDPNLRLHGVRNGYICSAAVFPTSGFSNPTHTVLALAVRLARHLNSGG